MIGADFVHFCTYFVFSREFPRIFKQKRKISSSLNFLAVVFWAPILYSFGFIFDFSRELRRDFLVQQPEYLAARFARSAHTEAEVVANVVADLPQVPPDCRQMALHLPHNTMSCIVF